MTRCPHTTWNPAPPFSPRGVAKCDGGQGADRGRAQADHGHEISRHRLDRPLTTRQLNFTSTLGLNRHPTRLRSALRPSAPARSAAARGPDDPRRPAVSLRGERHSGRRTTNGLTSGDAAIWQRRHRVTVIRTCISTLCSPRHWSSGQGIYVVAQLLLFRPLPKLS